MPPQIETKPLGNSTFFSKCNFKEACLWAISSSFSKTLIKLYFHSNSILRKPILKGKEKKHILFSHAQKKIKIKLKNTDSLLPSPVSPPTDLFTILELLNLPSDVPELPKIGRSPDVGAPKL